MLEIVRVSVDGWEDGAGGRDGAGAVVVVVVVFFGAAVVAVDDVELDAGSA